MSDAEMNTNVVKCWNEFVVLTHKHTVGLVMDPTSVQEKKSLLSYLLPLWIKCRRVPAGTETVPGTHMIYILFYQALTPLYIPDHPYKSPYCALNIAFDIPILSYLWYDTNEF